MRESPKTEHQARTPAQDVCGIEAWRVAQSALAIARGDRRTSCINQGARAPREAWEYRTDLLSTLLTTAIMGRPPAGQSFWEPIIGRVAAPGGLL